jgi:hypothetical protein
MIREERALVWLLRLAGGLMLLAFGAVFLPVEWMAATHRWLGLGEFPRSALVDYLSRSISILYGIHGGLYLVLAGDVRRFSRAIAYIGWMNVVFGALMVGIDAHAGLPLAWTALEGPPVAAFGAVLLWLVRAGRRAAPRGAA